MRPKKKDPPLVTLNQDEMTVKEIETLMTETDLTGYPIIVSKESQLLTGYILKKDLKTVLEQYRHYNMVNDLSVVQFSQALNIANRNNSVRLNKLVDFVSLN